MITEILKLMPRLKKKKNLSSSLFGKGCLLKSSQKARKEMLMTKVMGLDGLLKSPRQTRWTQFVMTKRTMLITITRRVGLGGPLKRKERIVFSSLTLLDLIVSSLILLNLMQD